MFVPASLSSLLFEGKVRAYPRGEHLVFVNIRQGWKGLPRTNTSIFDLFTNDEEKSFKTLTPAQPATELASKNL